MSKTINFPFGNKRVEPTIPYTVFVDESFDGFLGLAKPTGYFCYSALMVPTSKLATLKAFWDALKSRLAAEYETATGFAIGEKEFKSGYLNKLSFAVRYDIGKRISYFLAKNQCFVGGFYTTVDNFALYDLRTQIAMDDAATVLPLNWRENLPGIKEKLLEADDKTPGTAGLLIGLLHSTLEISLNWLGHQGLSFEVVYDPRQKKEDAFLLKHVGAWLSDEKSPIKRFPGIFRGATANISSCDSPGLMLTDLILRDLRHLFSDVPALIQESSSPDLILPIPQDDEPLIMSIEGARLKAGSIRKMSPELSLTLRKPTQNSMMPLYFKCLADRKLSYYAAFGEARTADFADWSFTDMLD